MTTLVVVALVVVVVAVVATLIVRGRRSTRGAPVAPPRAAAPELLVSETAPLPDLTRVNVRDRLGKSRGLFDRLRTLSPGTINEDDARAVEEVLLRSDVGRETTAVALEQLRRRGAPEGIVSALREILLAGFVTDRALTTAAGPGRVPVWLFVGVNGVGKTTTIGKVAHFQRAAGRKVLLAAGDTFRAAAADQLEQWATRTGSDIVRAGEGADPGSVVHDAIGRAHARAFDLVLADTAGRRANSANLLDELAKVRRVADLEPGQVVETLLVIDGTTGQNALSQVREFHQAAHVSGIVLTKLDGTARGGIAVALEREFALPVKLVGLGEGVDDLVAFDPQEFVDALLGA